MPFGSRTIRLIGASLALAALALLSPARSGEAQSAGVQNGASARAGAASPAGVPQPDFARMLRDQADTDRAWRLASEGTMRMEKITYRSSKGDLEIPAFVFQPLALRGPQRHPALVWVHEDIRGHLYEHHIPFIREAVARGYIVIAPEYRGSIGYGRVFYDAIDYGGAEVDDVVTAVSVLKAQYPAVDPANIGIVGWSHGGMIALLAVFRNPLAFKSAAALVPVTNLFHRLARKGIDQQRRAIDPQNRFGGSPSERPEVYRYRSPLFHVDELRIPLLVHVADNDEDVNIDEAMQLVDALRARRPDLADAKVYRNPAGGHLFDRRWYPATGLAEGTPEQRDSWARIWSFFGQTLQPGVSTR
ncbi:MAG: prolyl oligopeptidase family serine peptidase [Vicinamibacterales bacterium]